MTANGPDQPADRPSGHPPAPGYPTAPPRRGRWPIVLAIVGGVVALCCIGGVAAIVLSANKKDPDATGAPAIANSVPATPATTAAPGVGTAVRDGKFEFTVKNIECGRQTVGTDPLSKQAQGQFCLVALTVKNIGTEPQTLLDGNQKAFGSNGAQYSADSVAGLHANGNQEVWINEINPGNQVEGVVVFDIPSDSEITRLELHDSPFSNGVNVTVG